MPPTCQSLREGDKDVLSGAPPHLPIEGVHACGALVMTRTGAPRAYDRFEPTKRPDPPVPPVLAIRFVHAQNDTVDGMLEPYWDPECRCEVLTIFQGRQQGDRLSGTFTSRRDGIESQGRWEMKRRRKSSS